MPFFITSQHTPINESVINGSDIKSSNCKKILGITIDSDFTFEKHFNTLEEHINALCKKASQKLHVLSRFYSKHF